ncbi:unnamed protein product [Trifolium pratense]|nr:unnamed protein product [Trifolium pratense]
MISMVVNKNLLRSCGFCMTPTKRLLVYSYMANRSVASCLRGHYVQCPLECPMCLQDEEDAWHLFLECNSAREAWEMMGLEHMIQSRIHQFANIQELFLDICYKEDAMTVGKMATLLWCVWNNRNNLVWNNKRLNARQVGMQALHYWNEWKAENSTRNQQQNQQATQTAEQWQPPVHNRLKCNVDASFFNNVGATGWGWCIHDYRGRFILAGQALILFIKDSTHLKEKLWQSRKQ